MTGPDIAPDQAARALSEVARRRQQVVEAAQPLPPRSLALGVATGVLLFASMDLPPWPWLTPLRYLVLALPAVSYVLSRRRSVRPHPSLYGPRGWSLVLVTGVVIFVIGGAAAEFIHDRRPPLPFTLTGLVVGALLAIGGLLVNRWLRRIMRDGARSAAP